MNRVFSMSSMKKITAISIQNTGDFSDMPSYLNALDLDCKSVFPIFPFFYSFFHVWNISHQIQLKNLISKCSPRLNEHYKEKSYILDSHRSCHGSVNMTSNAKIPHS